VNVIEVNVFEDTDTSAGAKGISGKDGIVKLIFEDDEELCVARISLALLVETLVAPTPEPETYLFCNCAGLDAIVAFENDLLEVKLPLGLLIIYILLYIKLCSAKGTFGSAKGTFGSAKGT